MGRLAVALGGAWLILAGGVWAAEPGILSLPRLTQPPRLDGTLSAGEWEHAARLTALTSGPERVASRGGEALHLAWSAHGLWLAVSWPGVTVPPDLQVLAPPLPPAKPGETPTSGTRIVAPVPAPPLPTVRLLLAEPVPLPMPGQSLPRGQAADHGPLVYELRFDPRGQGEYRMLDTRRGRLHGPWSPVVTLGSQLLPGEAGPTWVLELLLPWDQLPFPAPAAGALLPVQVCLQAPGEAGGTWAMAGAREARDWANFPVLRLGDGEPFLHLSELAGQPGGRLQLAGVIHNPALTQVPVQVSVSLRPWPAPGAQAQDREPLRKTYPVALAAAGRLDFVLDQAFPVWQANAANDGGYGGDAELLLELTPPEPTPAAWPQFRQRFRLRRDDAPTQPPPPAPTPLAPGPTAPGSLAAPGLALDPADAWPWPAPKLSGPLIGGPITLTAAGHRLIIGSTGLPRLLEVAGQDLLAQPARLLMTVAGEPHELAGEQLPKAMARDPQELSFSGLTESPTWRLETFGRLSADGQLTLAWSLSPREAAKPVAIQDLRVEWPLAAAADWGWLLPGVGGEQATWRAGLLPTGPGVLLDSRRDFGELGNGLRQSSWVPVLWLGNDQRGLLFSGESDAGWQVDPRLAALTLERRGGELWLVQHLIRLWPGEEAVSVSRPRHWRLQVQPTPMRRPPAQWRARAMAPWPPVTQAAGGPLTLAAEAVDLARTFDPFQGLGYPLAIGPWQMASAGATWRANWQAAALSASAATPAPLPAPQPWPPERRGPPPPPPAPLVPPSRHAWAWTPDPRVLPFVASLTLATPAGMAPAERWPAEVLRVLAGARTFGTPIWQAPGGNPRWWLLHDSAEAGTGWPFSAPELRLWGIAAEDCEFVPYWRPRGELRELSPDLWCSMWRRPTGVLLLFFNPGLSPAARQNPVPVQVRLDLAALGVPKGLPRQQLWVQELTLGNTQILDPAIYGAEPWFQQWPPRALPNGAGQDRQRGLADLKLTADSGVLSGLSVGSQDGRLVAIGWEAQPASDRRLDLFGPGQREAAQRWGVARATELKWSHTGEFTVQAYRRPGGLLLRLRHHGNAVKTEVLTLPPTDGGGPWPWLFDLENLPGLEGASLAAELPGTPDMATLLRHPLLDIPGAAVLIPATRQLAVTLKPGQVRLLAVGTP